MKAGADDVVTVVSHRQAGVGQWSGMVYLIASVSCTGNSGYDSYPALLMS